MKYLGIDYGTKKIGVATSDDSGSVAFPQYVVQNTPEAHAELIHFARENGITQVVIGYSLAHDGTENPVMEPIRAFQRELEATGLVVHLEPEFYTTQQAKRMNTDALADASAAALILQSYIDTSAGGVLPDEQGE